MGDRVAIVGGGLAGLAAATEVAASGREVLLFEKRPRLGGRTDSWFLPRVGVWMDCGAHVLLSCYDATIHYLQRIGTFQRVLFQDRLRIDFADVRTKRKFALTARRNAGWAEMVLALQRLPIPISEKLSLLRLGGLAWMGGDADRLRVDRVSAEHWLRKRGQGGRIRDTLWEPLCRSTLNACPSEASAYLFRRVLEEAFFRGRDRARIGVFAGPMAKALIEPAKNFLEKSGAKVRLRAEVREVHLDSSGKADGVLIRDGSLIRADAVICALPPWDMAPVLERLPKAGGGLAERLQHLDPAGIMTVYVWTDRPLFTEPFFALLGTLSQWVFPQGEEALANDIRGHRYAVVISAVEAPLLKQGSEAIVTQIKRDLRQAFGGSNLCFLEARVVKYRRATPLFRPGTQRFRVPVRTPFRSLFLAGDHTDTRLPATIEGAIRSGFEAARRAIDEG